MLKLKTTPNLCTMFTKSYKQLYNPSEVVFILFINKENDRRSDGLLNIDKYIIERETTGHILFRLAAFQDLFPLNFRIILLHLGLFYLNKN